MSHLKQRKEQNCLNCQTSPLLGRYCHVCGQENLEPKETVWHLVQHFFNDITHFDGKFFSSVKYLLKKPGFLSAEYTKGRRASYLNPIRMYVFTSAIFFIILFSLRSSRNIVKIDNPPPKEVFKGLPDLAAEKTRLETKLKKPGDEDQQSDYRERMSHLSLIMGKIKKNYGDTSTRKFNQIELRALLNQAFMDSLQVAGGLPPAVRENVLKAMAAANDTSTHVSFFGLNRGKYRDVAQYDSIEKTLPDSLKDGWFIKLCTQKVINADEEFRHDSRSYQEHLVENFLHSFPKIMFFSLPFFALILRLLYVRRKQYLYVEHGIFTIHVYCATFLSTLALILIKDLSEGLNWGWLNVVSGILIFLLVMYMLIYLYKAMRTFYQQRRFKTIVKYVLLLFMATIVNTILLLLFLLISAISV